MFELIEEHLTAQVAEPAVVLPPKKALLTPDPIVIAMPEKFRLAKKSSSPMLLIALVGGSAVLVSGAVLVAVLIVNQPNKGGVSPPKEEAPAQATPAASAVPLSTESVLSSSTESSLDTSTTLGSASSSPDALTAASSSLASDQTIAAPETALPSAAPLATVAGVDTDSDGLSDLEEELFGTNAQKPDTNENTYLDGNEIRAGYDPASVPGGGHLVDAPTVNVYRNSLFAYSVLHPRLWIAKEVNALERETLISSATGEYVSIKVLDNPKKLTPREFAAAYAGVPASQVGENRKNTLWFDRPNMLIAETLDGLTAFVASTDSNGGIDSSKIIRLGYTPNLKQELNFETIFAMIVQSVRFGVEASSPSASSSPSAANP